MLKTDPQIEVEEYPPSQIDDVYASLGGGTLFSVSDLLHAFLQMKVQEPSSAFFTINRTHGLYHYQRLPYDVALEPAIWQQAMDHILQGIPGVFDCQDDIIVASCTPGEHLEQFMAVLKSFEEYGLKVNQEKCKFLRSFVEYLGHVISVEGWHQSSEKVKAITEMPKLLEVT